MSKECGKESIQTSNLNLGSSGSRHGAEQAEKGTEDCCVWDGQTSCPVHAAEGDLLPGPVPITREGSLERLKLPPYGFKGDDLAAVADGAKIGCELAAIGADIKDAIHRKRPQKISQPNHLYEPVNLPLGESKAR